MNEKINENYDMFKSRYELALKNPLNLEKIKETKMLVSLMWKCKMYMKTLPIDYEPLRKAFAIALDYMETHNRRGKSEIFKLQKYIKTQHDYFESILNT
jgi:hypothetical protein